MIINVNALYYEQREQILQIFQASKNEKRDSYKKTAASFPASVSSANELPDSQAMYRLKICMEEIKELQQQLSKLQEDEVFLEKTQDDLQKVEDNISSYITQNNLDGLMASSKQNDSETLLLLKKLQQEIKKNINERLVAQENISANVAAVREKNYAETIMSTIKNSINTERGVSLLSEAQLHRGSIRNLLNAMNN